MKYKKLQR